MDLRQQPSFLVGKINFRTTDAGRGRDTAGEERFGDVEKEEERSRRTRMGCGGCRCWSWCGCVVFLLVVLEVFFVFFFRGAGVLSSFVETVRKTATLLVVF